jgi:hypothetical protein
MKQFPNFLLIIAAVISLLTSCDSPRSYNATTIGEMEDLIKKGDMKTHKALKDLESVSHLYAIGSVTDLKDSS